MSSSLHKNWFQYEGFQLVLTSEVGSNICVEKMKNINFRAEWKFEKESKQILVKQRITHQSVVSEL